MNPDHFRKVVWMPALAKADIEYRPPIQTRQTFATMMISSGASAGCRFKK
jgi:integrase